jgi:hypothetical protein
MVSSLQTKFNHPKRLQTINLFIVHLSASFITTSSLGLNNLLRILFSNTLYGVHFSLRVRGQVLHTYETCKTYKIILHKGHLLKLCVHLAIQNCMTLISFHQLSHDSPSPTDKFMENWTWLLHWHISTNSCRSSYRHHWNSTPLKMLPIQHGELLRYRTHDCSNI